MKDSEFQRITSILTLSRIFLKFFSISLLIFILFSCGGSDTIRPESSAAYTPEMSTENIGDGTGGSSKSEEINALLLEKAINAAVEEEYILGPEDLIEIDIFQVGELKRTVRVSSSGFIKLPLAGKIKVSGLSVPELEAEITERYQKYLQEPLVSVFVKGYRSQKITVLGAVRKPQVYTVAGQKFLLDLLSMAEGLAGDAGDICYIQRGNETIVVNIRELLINGNARLNLPVFAGDVIKIPRGGVVFVNGSVKTPGTFAMKGTVKLTQAIAMAKGFRYEAKRDQIRVYRDAGTDAMDIIDVDYDAILEEKTPDIILKDKDIVIVPTHGVKNFFAGFVSALRGAVRIGSGSVSGGM